MLRLPPFAHRDCLSPGPLPSFFLQAQSLTYGAIVVSIVINKLVEYVIQTLNRFERHDYQDNQKANQMIRVWLFYYLNLTFTVLIAYAYSPSVPPALAQAAIFQGSFSDFTSQWCVPSSA